MKSNSRLQKRKGFTLVITISMMVLLTVISVGLLGLSSITLRAAGQGDAIAVARNNAKLAMVIALGELQRSAGPDQRITATADLRDSNASPAITGVWESWRPGSQGANDHESRKDTLQQDDQTADGNFVGWLASGAESSTPAAASPPGSSGAGGSGVTLVSDRPGADGGSVRGVHLPPTLVGENGAMAWTVIDEGVKARVDLPSEGETADAQQRLARLRAPGRPLIESISESTTSLRLDAGTAPKVVSMSQAEIPSGGPGDLRPYFHDLTTHSTSLPVNVADGGLKADLTRAFERNSLPPELANRHLYSNAATRLADNDPRFTALASYYSLYRNAPSANTPVPISLPNRYTPSRYDPRTGNFSPNLAPPDGTLIAPVVSRVQVVFSLVSRIAHGNWGAQDIRNATGDAQRTQMIYLIYNPVVTLYNPYSFPITFTNMKVTFRNVPVGFQFYRNGVPQTNSPTLLSNFHINSDTGGAFGTNWDNPFSLTISSEAGRQGGQVVLYPGEAKVFGATQPANQTWGNMTNYLYSGGAQSRLMNVFAGPGYDNRSGFIVDWLRPSMSGRTADNGSLGVFAARPTDRIDVAFMPMMPQTSGGRFSISIESRVNNRDLPIGVYEYTYGDEARLRRILEDGNHATLGQIRYPVRREVPYSVAEMNLGNPDNLPISQWGSRTRPFAVFSLATRAATESLYKGKPGRTSSFVHHVLQMDASRNHPAQLPMEVSLMPIRGNGDIGQPGSIDVDNADRAYFFGGNSIDTGAPHYVSQNYPTSPLVNLADLRHANLASSGHLPLTMMTVGESLGSPMVAADRAREAVDGLGYDAVDHSWFANNTLWDAYFFSGLRNQSDATALFNGGSLPLNPRVTPMLGSGTDPEEAAQIALSESGWSDLAALIANRGGFNVNSTSVAAWKAMLSSLQGLEVPVFGPVQINIRPDGQSEVVRVMDQVSMPRITRPVADAVDRDSINDNQRRWSGYRQLSDAEVELLAESIVEEVRSRGPFLSMAEFVNRRLGSPSDERSATGALEAAIRKSGVNDFGNYPGRTEITEAEAAALGFSNPIAAAGDTQEGATAFLTQGDLLSVIGAHATVRSDTFMIRAYGDARSTDGRSVLARAWCEVVVQRVPEFVDPSDEPEKAQPALGTATRSIDVLSPVNRRFGRRFEVVSFRWLSDDEV